MDRTQILKSAGLTLDLIIILIILVIWEVVWKAIALWRAARNGQLAWFVGLVLVNSVGILPIIYLLTNKKKEEVKEEKSSSN